MLVTDPPVQLGERLWMLGISQYPVYLVKGHSEAAIFEGATGSVGPVVLEQMEKLAVDKDSLRQLIIPHAHPDHVMAVPLLRQELPRLAVLASEQAAATLGSEKAISLFIQVDQALASSLLKSGKVRPEHRPKPLAEKRIAVDRVLKEGDTISVDGWSWSVLQTPGHSDCSLSFYQPQERVLLVSDAVGYFMPEHDCFWPDYFAGYEAYLRAIRRLAELETETLCLGHNGAIQGAEAVQAHLSRAISAAQQYHQRIVDQARQGKSVRQIAEELGSEIYHQAPLLPLEFFQKNCNLLVKRSLEYEGTGS